MKDFTFDKELNLFIFRNQGQKVFWKIHVLRGYELSTLVYFTFKDVSL